MARATTMNIMTADSAVPTGTPTIDSGSHINARRAGRDPFVRYRSVTFGLVAIPASKHEGPESCLIFRGLLPGCGGSLWTTPHTASLPFRFEVSWATFGHRGARS